MVAHIQKAAPWRLKVTVTPRAPAGMDLRPRGDRVRGGQARRWPRASATRWR
jgi:hypothetical protein